MKTKLPAVVLGSFLMMSGSLALAADVLSGDLGRLQGCWTAKAGPKHDIAVTLTIQGREVEVVIVTPQGIKLAVQGGLKLDETVSPRSIDWVGMSLLDGQELPDHLAIYLVEGDTFTLRNGGPNVGRPREFKPGDGPLNELLVFTRQKGESVAVK